MRQEIYEDDYGLEAWETSVRSRCYVHIVNSVQFYQCDGRSSAEHAAYGCGVYEGGAALV